MGSLSNNDSDGNENGIKQSVYISKTTTLLGYPFSLPPYPLPPTPFDACYAGYNFACASCFFVHFLAVVASLRLETS